MVTSDVDQLGEVNFCKDDYRRRPPTNISTSSPLSTPNPSILASVSRCTRPSFGFDLDLNTLSPAEYQMLADLQACQRIRLVGSKETLFLHQDHIDPQTPTIPTEQSLPGIGPDSSQQNS